jgi:uncharacterized protein (TIGR02246 family)
MDTGRTCPKLLSVVIEVPLGLGIGGRERRAPKPRGMSVRKLLLATAAVLLALPATAQDKATIQGLNDRFSEAFNKGDSVAVAAHYTDDAVLMPPGAPLMKGREAIQSFWKKGAEQLEGLRLTTLDVKPLGNDGAREIGTWAAKTKAASPQEMTGKYVVIWQKVGADWKLATDIWNSDK